MYTVKGYVGSEEKLKRYFAEHMFGGKTRVLFVADEVMQDHITCFEYLDSIRQPGPPRVPGNGQAVPDREGRMHHSEGPVTAWEELC